MAAIRFHAIIADNYGTHADQLSPSTVSDFQKLFLAVQQVYFLNAVLTKCSILYLYHRILSVQILSFVLSCSLLGRDQADLAWSRIGH